MNGSIKIDKVENSDKFLLQIENTYLYVGELVQDIILLLKDNKDYFQITFFINDKYKSNYSVSNVREIIEEKILPLFDLKVKRSRLIKLVTLLNPSRYGALKKLTFLYQPIMLIVLFTFCVIVNAWAYTVFVFAGKYSSANNNFSINEKIIFYISLISLLFLHEIGHSIAALKHKIKTYNIGFGFYTFIPVFFIDLNETWRLNKEKRIIINIGGVYFQLITGMLLFMLNFLMPGNAILRALIISNIYIILINLNPFLRFDGYWIISDLFNIVNLENKSNKVIKELFSWKFNKDELVVLIYAFLKFIFIAVMFYLFICTCIHLIFTIWT